jgi:gluconokinase
VPESRDSAEVVLGVDLGTTATKVVALDTGGRTVTTRTAGYDLDSDPDGRAEQDPDAIAGAARAAIAAAAADVRTSGQHVGGLAFSGAMHGLLGLGADGRPVTRVLTWADTRAAAHAERLRTSPEGRELHRRTGTPVHPGFPLSKLLWVADAHPEWLDRARTWCGAKAYVVAALTGELATDVSMASGTGLYAIEDGRWDAGALARCGLDADRLPPLVATTDIVGALLPQVAEEIGLPAGLPVVAGGGDGPLANLGVGAVRPKVAACSIGTSGALRVPVRSPGVDPDSGCFCYAVAENLWVLGGAITNGGLVLQWAGEHLLHDPAPAQDAETEAAALARAADLAASVPAGAGGLLMLPYLLGERAPHWDPTPRAAFVGLTRDHGRAHLLRAAMEGVCLQLRWVLTSVCASGHAVDTVRATGGFARSEAWRQTLADVLDTSVGFPTESEGSGAGAAILGLVGLGLLDDIAVAEDFVRIAETRDPQPEEARRYDELFAIYTDLYTALAPTYRRLREAGPRLPLRTLPELS